MQIPFLGGAYEGRSSNVSPETCINLFYEKGISGESLVGVPGYEIAYGNSTWTPRDAIRGSIAYDNKSFFVKGDKFGTIDNPFGGSSTATNFTELGTLKTRGGRVSMAHNGVRPGANQQIMIVDGKYGYIWDNSAETFSEITDTDFTSTDTVAFIDGYFIFPQKDGSDRFWITASYDGTSIDPSDFSTAEGWPDPIQTVIVDNRQVFIFGTETLEIWFNTGDTDNTFQRFQGGFKQHGCGAKFTPSRIDNSIMWLSQNDRGDRQIVRLGEGYMPRVISTPEIDYKMSLFDAVSDAWAYTYQSEGHEFYVINFPTGNKTFAYDASTQMWHERVRCPQETNKWQYEGFTTHLFSGGEHYFGDQYGYIWRMDPELGSFCGQKTTGGNLNRQIIEVIPRERTTAPISDEENRTRISSLQLDMEEGVFGDPDVVLLTDGIASVQNRTAGVNDPEEVELDAVYMKYSKNGGHTWTNETKRDMGNGGQFFKRVIWRRLGWARNWIFKFRFYSFRRPVLKGLIVKAYGERNG